MNYGSFSLGSAYEYYANGLKKSFTNADAVKHTYIYDAANRLSAVEIPGMGSITYNEYEWAIPKKITLPGGTVKTFEYDPLMQVKGIMVKDPADNILMNYSYTRDKEGNILSKSSLRGAEGDVAISSYSYDKTYQLLKTIYPGNKSETFTYDPAGNRLERRTLSGVEGATSEVEAYTHNANNEMLSTVIASEAKQSLFEFDSNGNMVKKVDGANTFEYVYNLENRLAEVKLNTHTLATYGYDPFGRRLWKEVGGVRNYFFYTDEGLTGEMNASGEVVKTYGYTPNSIWTTDPLWTREGGQYYFYHNDHLATPQMITASNGTVVWSADYESFGKATVGTETVKNNLRFPGQYFDGETEEHYNCQRNYMPGIGRYSQVDPIGFWGEDENLFRYGGNKPSVYYDCFGFFGAGDWDPLKRKGYLGHGNFENDKDGCNFDWNREDRGLTNPWLPNFPAMFFVVWRHFRSYDGQMIEDLMKDINNCNKRKFERHMHQMQDYFAHYDAGFNNWWNKIIGHVSGGHTPDEADPNSPNDQYYRWQDANNATIFWVKKWNEKCKCSNKPKE